MCPDAAKRHNEREREKVRADRIRLAETYNEITSNATCVQLRSKHTAAYYFVCITIA